MNKFTKSQEWSWLVLISFIVVTILFNVYGDGDSNWTKPRPPKYTSTEYTLPDGTSCHIIRGGAHSGYIGVTCDYTETPNDDDK